MILNVYQGGTTYTYEADTLEEQDVRISERANAENVEMADLQLKLDGDFLGQQAIDQVPGQLGTRFRAQLLVNGNEVMNGTIARNKGVRHDPNWQRWIVTLVQDAAKEMVDRFEGIILNSTSFRDDLPSGTTVLIQSGPFQDGQATTYILNEADLLNPVWDAVCQQANVTWNMPQDFFEWSVRYLDSSSTEQTITRTPSVGLFAVDPAVGPLPEWTAKKLFEGLQAALGWRLRVSYDAFPSTALIADVIPDEWQAAPAGVPSLDGYTEDDGYLLEIEAPEYPDLAITYKNDVTPAPDENRGDDADWQVDTISERNDLATNGDISEGETVYVAEDDTYYEYDPNHPDADGNGFVELKEMIPPPKSAIYAAALQEKLDEDGEPDHESLIELPARLPYLLEEYLETTSTPDSSGHPDYSETIRYAKHFTLDDDGRNDLYIFALIPDPDDASYYRIVVNRKILASRPSGQEEIVQEIWAQTLIDNYQLTQQEVLSLQGRFDIGELAADAYAVGDTGKGVMFDDRYWMVTDRKEAPKDESVDLTLKSLLAGAGA